MTWTTKKDDLVKALDDLTHTVSHYSCFDSWQEPVSEQIGELRSLVDHLPEEPTKHLCNTCDHLSDISHELDPLGDWKWCALWGKDVLEDSYVCRTGWKERTLTWPEDKEIRDEKNRA